MILDGLWTDIKIAIVMNSTMNRLPPVFLWICLKNEALRKTIPDHPVILWKDPKQKLKEQSLSRVASNLRVALSGNSSLIFRFWPPKKVFKRGHATEKGGPLSGWCCMEKIHLYYMEYDHSPFRSRHFWKNLTWSYWRKVRVAYFHRIWDQFIAQIFFHMAMARPLFRHQNSNFELEYVHVTTSGRKSLCSITKNY